VDAAIRLVKEERRARVVDRATAAAEEKLVDLLVASLSREGGLLEGREKIRRDLREGRHEGRELELEVTDDRTPQISVMTPQGVEEMGIDLPGMLPNLFGGPKKKNVRLPVSDARPLLLEREADALTDEATVPQEAIRRAEETGIVFLDEIDKIAGREGTRGPDVSREGVQRDLLPLVEGTTVKTKHGMVKTDHVLFIAAGAFHVARPSDLIPELQGRFPIRVTLDALTEADFQRILTEPEHSLPRQSAGLLSADGIEVVFAGDGLAEIARAAAEVNGNLENIGARRLHTILETVLEEISFAGPDAAGARVVIDKPYVERALADLVRNRDLSRFVL
jgi:ATP-dependent HslUV protease ATP-binding subunit HslU